MSEEKAQGDNKEKDNIPLSWRIKRSFVHSDPVSTKDQVRQDNGKGKTDEGKSSMVVHSYTTRGVEKKLLSDAMRSSKQKHISKKKLRKTTVVKPDIPEDQVVNVKEDDDIDWTDLEKEESEKRLDTKAKKKVVVKGKGRESASTRGPDSYAKRRRTEKALTKDQQMRLLQAQKVLNG